MSIEYKLTIAELVCKPDHEGQANVIETVRWIYTGTDGVRSVSIGGYNDITYEVGAHFTPYDRLEHDQIAAWVTDNWSREYADMLQSEIAKGLDKVKPQLPW